MFLEVEFHRNVAVYAESLDRNELVASTSRLIITRLLEDLSIEKASKNHGYFLSVTRLKSIGRAESMDESGNILFPVVFNCRTFLPARGEVFQGVVHLIYQRGVFLRCGPIKYVFLSSRKMPNYEYVSEENPVFLTEDHTRIQKGVVVRFSVLDVRWIEKRWSMKREFVMLASLEGDSLGPVSLAGYDELEM